MTAAGTLVVVVGSSGAGKDTLIEGARAALAGNPGYVFARRTITRPRDAGGEDHEAVDEAAFAERQRGGGFLVTWRAHGLGYGLAASLADDLAAGRSVIANVSRAALAGLIARFPEVLVVEVSAPVELRAQRLAARGREDAADIAARLAREGAGYPAAARVVTVVNDSGVAEGVARFLAALGEAA